MSTNAASVLIVNPNTNTTTTAMLTAFAAENLEPHHLGAHGVTVAAGPSMIIDAEALADSAEYVVQAAQDVLLEDPAGLVAVIVGAIGDPGRSTLASQVPVPVIGIGQASILAAAQAGRRFGMATSTPDLVSSLEGLVVEHGKASSFTGVQLTTTGPLQLADNPERQFEELAEAVRRCVQTDGAETVIIAGGPLSETARRIATLGLATIIEPIPSACDLVRHTLHGSS